jgi:hypothetical protein
MDFASLKPNSVYTDVTPELFNAGCGRIIAARRKSGDRMEVGIIFLDVFCCGVTDSDFRVVTIEEFSKLHAGEAAKVGPAKPIQPACARKLIEGAVAYARNFGFAPHRHLNKAMRVFGGIRTEGCSETYVYGDKGKPHYIQSPDAPPELAARIFVQLYRRCGEGNFSFILTAEAAEVVSELFDRLGLPQPGAKSSDRHGPADASARLGEKPAVGMAPFHARCPEIGVRQTRSVTVEEGAWGLPHDDYAFLEHFCVDPECDCRRVLLQVISQKKPGRILATIAYGWEAAAFYADRSGVSLEEAESFTEPELDPMNPQSEYSEGLLSLFEEVLMKDRAYLERLKTHYWMFREKIQRETRGRDT